MRAEIISVGTELLLGEIIDTNSVHLAQTLAQVGIDLYFMTTVGDNQQRITSAIDLALDRADLVITTGGLGPTVDDVTRQAIAEATGKPLEFHQALLDEIAARFARFGSRMSENNRQQAYVPQDAFIINNPVGTAPSFAATCARGVVIALPGVPREMKYLLEHAVIPYLQTNYILRGLIKARILRTAGIGESMIDEAIGDLMTQPNPTVGLAAHVGQADIRITAKAPDEATADRMIAETEAEIRARLGTYIYGTGDERIEHALVTLLGQRGMHLAITEAGTNGTLKSLIDAVKAETSILAMNHAYTDEAALISAFELHTGEFTESNEAAAGVALEAARQTATKSRAEVNLAVIAAPDGVAIGIVTPSEEKIRYYQFDQSDDRVLVWASTWGMAQAWRSLIENN